MTDSNATLLSCPFCGGEAELCIHKATGASWVRCTECETISGASSAKQAIESWNTRAEQTCEFPTSEHPPKCSTCGWQTGVYDCDWLDGGKYKYDGNFCKSCGARVVKQ